MSIFKLPDLGEGLQEADIVEWHVKEGDVVKEDQPLLAVETAKAIVDIPSPQSGRVHRLYAENGEIVKVGDPLVEFEAVSAEAPRQDSGTVVGHMESSNKVIKEQATSLRGRSGGGGVGNVKATPAVRALAKRLEVDLAVVTPSGPDGTVIAADVQRVARILQEAGPLEPIRGVRRAMAQAMAKAHEEVANVTIVDRADIYAWQPKQNPTIRLIRALVMACKEEPGLNAWFDAHAMGRRVRPQIDLGIAVDTPDGLFVPVLKDVGNRNLNSVREALNKIKEDVKARTIPPEEMRGATITLSNFGTIGGLHADPIVVPPTVAILGAGRIHEAVVPCNGEVAIHRIVPLSLTVDHRAVTGGEAARFLMAVIRDLEKPG